VQCLVEDRVEHRCQITGRRIDDLQYLGGRGLLLQRLTRLGQQPRVLHRDHRLRREILKQCDLFLAERAALEAIGADIAEQPAVLPQREHEQGAETSLPRGARSRAVPRRPVQYRCIGHMNQALTAQQLVLRPARFRPKRLPQQIGKRRRQFVCRHGAEVLAIIGHQSPVRRAAQRMRLLQYRVEHWREIAGRRINDLQYLVGRGLLLQGLARLGQ